MHTKFITSLAILALLFCNCELKVVFITEDTSTSFTNGFGKEFYLNRDGLSTEEFFKRLDINKLSTITQNQHKNIWIADDERPTNLFTLGGSAEEILEQQLAINGMNAVLLNYLQEANAKERLELLTRLNRTPRVLYY